MIEIWSVVLLFLVLKIRTKFEVEPIFVIGKFLRSN